MDQENRQKIKRILTEVSTSKTVKDKLKISPGLLYYFKVQGALKQWDVDDITRKLADSDKVDALLQRLKLKHASAYDAFVKVLETYRYELFQDIRKLETKYNFYRVGTDSRSKDNFIRLHLAVQYICQEAIPCISHTLKTWHDNEVQRLHPCQTPTKCATKGKPKPGKSCSACVDWGNAIDAVYYKSHRNSQVAWPNINPTRLHHDPIEAAKAFVLRLVPGKTYSSLGDFDAACLLMVMMNFTEFHRNDPSVNDKIKKVSSIRNELSHMNVDDQLVIGNKKLDTSFLALDDLAQALMTLHPKYFHKDLCADIQEYKSCPLAADTTAKALLELKETTTTAYLDLSGKIDSLSEDIRELKVHATKHTGDGRSATNEAPYDNSEGRTPESERIAETVDSPLHRCQDILRSHYLDATDLVDLKDIYTKISININLPKPCRPIKIPLLSLHEMFSRKTDEGRVYNKLLISVPAGFGKTTTTAKIAYDWSALEETDSPLANIRLLFVINMRWVDHTTDLEDAILTQVLPDDTTMTKAQLRDRLQELGERVIIILDAVDESDRELFNHPENSGSIVKLLTGKILTSCRLVVTTRPWRVPEIADSCKAFINLDITGFSKEDVKTYIRQFFKQETDLGESLVRYIEQNAVMAEVCVVPLMCLLVCIYWKETREASIPDRIGLLYDEIFDIMYTHMQSKKPAAEAVGIPGDRVPVLIQHLGKMALEGLWPPENRLVFSVDKSAYSGIVEEACQMGLVAKEEGYHPGRRLKLNTKSLHSDKKLTFFHKTAQEKCAGVYLASLVNIDPAQLQSYLGSLETLEDVFSVELILQFASGRHSKAAEMILQRLIDIFKMSGSPLLEDFYSEDLDLNDTLRIQRFLEICLKCNYEADCKDMFSYLLGQLYSQDRIYFLGISSPTALALGYYMEHSQPGAIKSLTLRPSMHPRSGMYPRGVLGKLDDKYMEGSKQIPLSKIEEICQEYLKRHKDEMHKDHVNRQETTPVLLFSHIQLWQACEHLPAAGETNLTPVLNGLQHTKIREFDFKGFPISSNIDNLTETCTKGCFSQLLELNMGHTGLKGNHTEQLAKFVRYMPNLKVIDISDNEARKSLEYLAEAMESIQSVEKLDLSYMDSSSQQMDIFMTKLQDFGQQLLALQIIGNAMNDAVASKCEAFMARANQLQHLEIHVHGISRERHNKLILAIGHLHSLRDLYVGDSEYPSALLETTADLIESLTELQVLALSSSADDTSPMSISSSWQIFRTKLVASKLKELYLLRIYLQKDSFLDMIDVCREKEIHLRYQLKYVPEDVPIPQDEICIFA